MSADDRLTVDQLAALAPSDSVTIESGAESAGIATRPAPSSGWTVRTLSFIDPSFIDPEVKGHLRDRLAGLERQPDRTGLEILESSGTAAPSQASDAAELLVRPRQLAVRRLNPSADPPAG